MGNIYTRIMNPTQDALEQRVASLEGGVAALAVASGQAAETLAILNIAEAGDHIVASASLYGGTYNLLHHSLPKLGVTVSFVEDPDDPENWQSLVQDNTKAFFAETIGNPKGDVLDIERRRRGRAPQRRPADRRQHHRHAVPDPAVRVRRRHRRPLGDQVPGRARHRHRRRDRRRGNFDWTSGKFPGFTTPDPTYHGVVYASLGAPAFALKARVQLLRDLGPAISPFNAFLVVQGIETLSLRIERHVRTR